MSRFDALVIGGGPAGSVIATRLARAGWDVALVEKSTFPRRKVCGECIAAPNLPLLEALGVGEELARCAGPALQRTALMTRRHAIEAPLPASTSSKHPWGRAWSREHLDTALMEAARRAGVNVLQPWSARELAGSPGDYACRIAAPHQAQARTLHAPVIIAAHGSWEMAPTAGAMSRLHRPTDLLAFKATFRKAILAPGLLPVLAFEGGYGGMVIAEDETLTLAFCMRRDMLARCRRTWPSLRAAEAAAAWVAAQCKGVSAALAGAEQLGDWLSVGPLRPGVRMPRDGGPVFLVGNAAGEAHPIIGEGISMAIQSSWMLADLLAPARQVLHAPDVLRRVQRDYATAWHQHFPRRIRLAAAFAQLAMRPALAAGLLPLLRAWPALLTHAARWSDKTKAAVRDATAVLQS